ncbi:hypothetical protein RRG08_034656 [Elysia crispata]|uniref:Uncharacterized protein n=1 Tax=Elysia crispata TaxID=231223 RepID=A0AAE1B3U3_9GAST|nr:hypothetical protein RRG08_034656 [Elysia crispata]
MGDSKKVEGNVVCEMAQSIERWTLDESPVQPPGLVESSHLKGRFHLISFYLWRDRKEQLRFLNKIRARKSNPRAEYHVSRNIVLGVRRNILIQDGIRQQRLIYFSYL